MPRPASFGFPNATTSRQDGVPNVNNDYPCLGSYGETTINQQKKVNNLRLSI